MTSFAIYSKIDLVNCNIAHNTDSVKRQKLSVEKKGLLEKMR